MATDQITLDFSADVARDRERLTALALELGTRAGRGGITVSDVRIQATNRFILTGEETLHRMNQLAIGKCIRNAGLVANGDYRRSSVPRAKRSLNAVYVLPEYAEGAA